MATKGYEHVTEADLVRRPLIGTRVPARTTLEDARVENTTLWAWVLPWPPTVNEMWRRGTTGGGRKTMFLSKSAVAFKARVAAIFGGGEVKPSSAPMAVILHFYRPTKIGDIDNRIKPVFDALNGVIWHDDQQIVEVHAYRHDDADKPRVEISVNPLPVEEPLLLDPDAVPKKGRSNGRRNQKSSEPKRGDSSPDPVQLSDADDPSQPRPGANDNPENLGFMTMQLSALVKEKHDERQRAAEAKKSLDGRVNLPPSSKPIDEEGDRI